MPGYREPAPGYGTPRVPGYLAPPSADQPPSWQLVLSPGAKRLVGLILVLGLLTAVGEGVSVGARINSIRHRDMEINQLNVAIARHNSAVATEQQEADQAQNAITRVTAAYEKLGSELKSMDNEGRSCTTKSCALSVILTMADDTGAFGRTVTAVPFPAVAAADSKRLIAAAVATDQALIDVSRAVSSTDLTNRFTQAENAGNRVDKDYSALMESLNQQAAALKQQAATLDQQAAALDLRGGALNVPVKVQYADAPSSPSLT